MKDKMNQHIATTKLTTLKQKFSNFLNLAFFLFFYLSTFINCQKEENPYIPTPDIFTRNFTDVVPKIPEIEIPFKEILNTGTLFCGNSFQNKKIELTGENENIFIQDKEQFSASAYFSIYQQKIKNKPDIFVLKTRCCPMGPCFTSYFFQKQQSGKWKLFDTISGEVIDYKKTKEQTIIKIEDNSLTGLTYIGFWKEGIFDTQLAYRYMNIEIPLIFSPKKKVLVENKEFNLLKKPKDYHIDNLSFRIKAPANTNVFVLSESERHYFVMIKASPEQIENVLENFREERENLIPQIQGLGTGLKKNKDLEKLLKRTFYHIGWVEKF